MNAGIRAGGAPPLTGPGPWLTVTIWHNITADAGGHPTGMLEGYKPGDLMVRVFTYQARPAAPEVIAEQAWAICNGHPAGTGGADLTRQYYARELRSLCKGDAVTAGEITLAAASAGWTPVRGEFREVRASVHGTRPLPRPARGEPAARPGAGEKEEP